MNQIEFETLGVPTVTAVTPIFLELAKAVASAGGVPDISLVTVPHPMGMVPANEVEAKAVGAFPEIIKGLTAGLRPSESTKSTSAAYPAERFQFAGTVPEVNKLFCDKGWSLGIPIIPPVAGDVQTLLNGTSRKAHEVLGKVPPLMATLTVELVAVNAAMAGCKPEYMPLLISAMEALLAPEVNWSLALSTTGTSQSVVIVNGPVVRQIGLATGQGAAGKGYHANAAIGYAINLIAYVVGGSRPPSLDKSTLGSPADYVCWIVGENESRLPAGWQPLHVDRGFKQSDSVVTVMVSYPPVDNIDHWSMSPQEHLRWWSHLINPMLNIGGPCNTAAMEVNPIVALGPEHAQLVASTGWTKEHFRKALWEGARLPLSAWPSGCPDTRTLVDKLGPLTPESMVPITFDPEQILIVLAGGDGKHSHYFPPFPASFAMSRIVTG
ncbi:MAG: hypothetical protein HYX90_07090 [Chloroflexi bacterium]|nr:hypothetical protein [Chloroflexota bacterium]